MGRFVGMVAGFDVQAVGARRGVEVGLSFRQTLRRDGGSDAVEGDCCRLGGLWLGEVGAVLE